MSNDHLHDAHDEIVYDAEANSDGALVPIEVDPGARVFDSAQGAIRTRQRSGRVFRTVVPDPQAARCVDIDRRPLLQRVPPPVPVPGARPGRGRSLRRDDQPTDGRHDREREGPRHGQQVALDVHGVQPAAAKEGRDSRERRDTGPHRTASGTGRLDRG